MARFLIEVEHEPEVVACARAIQLLLQTGSHFVTNAEWGCMDHEHRGWIIVEADSKDEARCVLPPLLRPGAKVVGLSRFSLEEIGEILRVHGMP